MFQCSLFAPWEKVFSAIKEQKDHFAFPNLINDIKLQVQKKKITFILPFAFCNADHI